MAEVALHLPRPHAGQVEIIQNAKRWNVVCCGRRFGKSVLAIDRLVEPALAGFPVAYFAPTYKTLLEVWREIARTLAPAASKVNASERRIELVTGGVIEFWQLDADPESCRGRKYKRVVIDEAAKARHLETAWRAAIRATLVDFQGDAWFMSTPRGKDFFASLYARGDKSALKVGQTDPFPEWASFTASTAKNPHIPASEIEEMRADLGPRLYAQEVEALILAEREGALWSQGQIDRYKVAKLPEMRRIVIGVDPATTSNDGSNRTGIVVAGVGFDKEAYILADRSVKGTPHEWATAVCRAYDEFKADKVVGETNQGGDLIEHTLRTITPSIAYKGIHARRGKILRAEPVAALYEQGKCHHADDAALWELEAEMTNWIQGEESPDRLDALVHALTELMIDGPKGVRNQSLLPKSTPTPFPKY